MSNIILVAVPPFIRVEPVMPSGCVCVCVCMCEGRGKEGCVGTVLTADQLLTYSNHWVEDKAVLLLLPHLLGNCVQ